MTCPSPSTTGTATAGEPIAGRPIYLALGVTADGGRSFESLSISLEDRFRYTFTGWAEDITRQRDGSTRFRVVFRWTRNVSSTRKARSR